MILTCHQGQALQEQCHKLQRLDEEMSAGAASGMELQGVRYGVCGGEADSQMTAAVQLA